MTYFRMHVNEELKLLSAHSNIRHIKIDLEKHNIAILLYCKTTAPSYGKIKFVERAFLQFLAINDKIFIYPRHNITYKFIAYTTLT